MTAWNFWGVYFEKTAVMLLRKRNRSQAINNIMNGDSNLSKFEEFGAVASQVRDATPKQGLWKRLHGDRPNLSCIFLMLPLLSCICLQPRYLRNVISIFSCTTWVATCSFNLTLKCPAAFEDFWRKKCEKHVASRGNFSGLVCSTHPVSLKRRGKSSSLHSKKNFCLGDAVFLWVTS